MLSLFIAIFFIATPIIIMYTAGYRYDWKNGLLKETGAISIDIEPQNTTILLNGLKIKDKMPIRLNNIAPGRYELEMSAPDFYSWIKEIEVKNKQTAYIKEITLLKKNNPQIVIKGKINNLSLSADGQFIIYNTQNNGNTEIWLWNNKEQKPAILFRLDGLDPIKIIWAENNDYAVISNLNAPYSKLVLVDANNLLRQTDLVKNIGSPIEKFEWDQSPQPQLYFSAKNKIFFFSPTTKEVKSLVKNAYLDWHMEKGQLWTLQLNTTTQQQQIVKDTLGFSSNFNTLESIPANDSEKNGKWKILASHQNTILLKNTGSPQVVLFSDNKKFNFSGENFLISKYNNWWLIWTQWELWTFSEGETEPYLLNRSGEHLQQVIPLDKYNTLALVWADKTTALFPYYLVSHNLIANQAQSVAADTEQKILYFTAKIKGGEGIWKLRY